MGKSLALTGVGGAGAAPSASPALIASVTSGNQDHHTSASINTTGANFIAVLIAFYDPNDPDPVLSDSKSNTWSALTAYTDAYVKVNIYYCASPTVGAGHTFTLTGLNKYSSLVAAAFSNVHATPVDVENGANGSGTSIQTGSVTPSQNGSLLIAAVGTDNTAGGAAWSINSSFSIVAQIAATADYTGCGMAYYVQPSASAINPTWTNATTWAHLAAAIASFKPA